MIPSAKPAKPGLKDAVRDGGQGRERVKPAAIPPSPAPPTAKTLKERPVLRLPAFRQKCG